MAKLARSFRRSVAAALAVVLVVTAPGPESWAAFANSTRGRLPSAGRSAAGPAPAIPSLSLPVLAPAAAPAGLPSAAALPALPAAAARPGAPSTPLAGPAMLAGGFPGAAAVPAAPTANAQAAAARELSGETGPLYDGAMRLGSAGAGSSTAGSGLPRVPSNLKLAPADEQAAAQFTAEFHSTIAEKFPDYAFTIRDYYAWVRFIRQFTPSMGLKVALRAGAAYVYGDSLEDLAQREAFDKELANAVKNLQLTNPDHGKDAKVAAELLKLAEPGPEAYADDEESPFKIPLNALIPDKKRTDLQLTPTTLRRIEAAYRAFAMRDYAMLVGPPATQKSAIPKYLAAQNGIPHLAVTMHPGIGTFELVGGYRPKVVKIDDPEAARRIVAERLAKAEAAGDFSDIMESAAKVYGGSLESALASLRKDLAEKQPEALRRLTTLAHGIEHGAASLQWQDGYLTYALKRDIWITFEEFNAAPTEVQEFLNEFMRSRRLVITQKLGEPLVVSPRAGGRFMLWATKNPDTDPNREVIAQTLKNRWRTKYFGDLPAFEQAEIIEKVFGLRTALAMALVENVHKELSKQARGRLIGDQWRDGYEINMRHLLKVARRWRYFVDQETDEGNPPNDKRKLFLLGREAYSIYGGLMRLDTERHAAFVMINQALRLGDANVRAPEDLIVRPDRIEDLGDRIRVGDVELEKGQGGEFVPRPNPDYLADESAYGRLYEYAKALALGEPLLVMGESAAGKTTDLEYLFFRLNKNMRYKNLDSDSAIEDVIGGYAPGERRGQYLFREGMLPAAMEEGSGAFLDEFNLNPLVEWLNTVIDDGRLYLPERIVQGRPMLVAAGNPPDPRYPGRILLSPATRSRYTELWAARDDSKPRLKRLMEHWLKGGAAYALLAPLFIGSLLGGPGLGAMPRRRVASRRSPQRAAPQVQAFPGHSRGELPDSAPLVAKMRWAAAALALPASAAVVAYQTLGASWNIVAIAGFFVVISLFWLADDVYTYARQEGWLHPHNKKVLSARARALARTRPNIAKMLVGAAAAKDSTRRESLTGLKGAVSVSDAEVLAFLADLAVAETSRTNIQAAATAIAAAGALDALEKLSARLGVKHGGIIAKARESADMEVAQAREIETLASAAPVVDVVERAQARVAQLGSSMPEVLRAGVLREAIEKIAKLRREGDRDAEALAAARLEQLLSSESSTGLAAFVGGFFDRFTGLFRSKKKAVDDSDAAGPTTLEELFEERRIPEAQREELRAKAGRVRTLMKMVGSSVSRDQTLKWEPGDLWAFFPESNTATYPIEHLITHSEDELIGVIDHEALHRETTVFDMSSPLMRKYLEDPFKHFLWNGLEDPRINSRGIHRLPGAERYLHALYDRYLPKDGARPEDAADVSQLPSKGDGGTAFDNKALQLPHIEFIMAANYYWRYGQKPPSFVNKSAERAFDAAKADLDGIFATYPRDADPSREQARLATLDALRQMDEKVLPLYEDLVGESQKKLADQMKGGKKGKGQGQSQGQKGGKQQGQGGGQGQKQGGGAPQPSPNQRSNDQQKNEGDKKHDSDSQDKDSGDGEEDENKEKDSESKSSSKESKDEKKARKQLQDHARRAAESLRGQMKDSPTKGDLENAKQEARERAPGGPGGENGQSQPGNDAPRPLSIEDVARTQREQIMNRESTPYQSAYQPIAHLSSPMVTYLENVFLKNARPKDAGYFKEGKRPDLKRAMKREGEGGVRDDIMLRRRQASKRKYKVTLLVDESGSMDGFRREAIQTVVLFVDALSRLQIEVEVIGFSETARIHKKFGEPLSHAAKDRLVAELQEHIGKGNTHDADALALATERILKEDADERFVFVVTDGAGNGKSRISDVLPAALKNGVHVLGVGVGAGMQYVKSVYPRHAAVSRVEDLPKTLRDSLMESITRVEGRVRGAAQKFLLGGGFASRLRAFGGRFSWGEAKIALETLSAFAFLAAFAFGLSLLPLLARPFFAFVVFLAPLISALRLYATGRRGEPRMIVAYMTAAVFLVGLTSLHWIVGPLAAAGVAFLPLFRSISAQKRPLPAYVEETAYAAARRLKDPAMAKLARRLAGFESERLDALHALRGKPLPEEFVEVLEMIAYADESKSGDMAGALIREHRQRLLEAIDAAEALKKAALPPIDASDLETLAEKAIAESGEAFVGRLRRGALQEALDKWRSARQDGNAEAEGLEAGRLRRLLAGSSSSGLRAFGFMVSRGEFAAASIAVLTFLVIGASSITSALLPLTAQGILGSVMLIVLIAAAEMGTWRRTVALAAVFALFLGYIAGASSLGIAALIAAFLFVPYYVAVLGALKPVKWGVEQAIIGAARDAKTPKMAELARRLGGYEQSRLAALRSLNGVAPPDEKVVTVITLLSFDDPSPDVRAEAERIISARERKRDEAEAAATAARETAKDRVADLEADARKVVAAADGSLTGRLLRQTLIDALSALETARKNGDAEAELAAIRRLDALLNAFPHRGLNAFANWQSSIKALGRLLFRPALIMTAIIFGVNFGLFALVAAVPFAFQPFGGLFAIVFFMASCGLFGRSRAAGVAILLSLTLAMAVTSLTVPAVIGLFASTSFYFIALMQKPNLYRPWFGFFSLAAEQRLRNAARGLSLDPVQRRWAQDLAGRRSWRLTALEEMRRDPARSRPLAPVLRELWTTDDYRALGGIVDVVERWGDEQAVQTLEWMAAQSNNNIDRTSILLAAGTAAKRVRAQLEETAAIERMATAHFVRRAMDDMQARWAEDLGGLRRWRMKALQEMRADPARSRQMELVLRALWKTDDSETLRAIVDVVERWNDKQGRLMLVWMSQNASGSAAARLAGQAADRIKQAADADAAAVAEQAKTAGAAAREALIAEAEALIEALAGSPSMSDRLRRLSVGDSLRELREAAHADATAVAERRLRERLDEGGAAGLGAFPRGSRQLQRLLTNPEKIVPPIIVIGTALIFNAVMRFAPAFAWSGAWALVVGVILAAWSTRSNLGSIAKVVFMTALLAVVSVNVTGYPIFVMFAVMYLHLKIVLPPEKYRPQFGYLSKNVETEVRAVARFIHRALDDTQARWAEDLGGRRRWRMEALEEMRADPARSRQMELVLRALWKTDDLETLQAIVDVVERWNDKQGRLMLVWMSKNASRGAEQAARAARQAADLIKQAAKEAAALNRLAEQAKTAGTAAREALIAEAEALIEALAGSPSMSDRLRRLSVGDSLRELREAADADAAAVAERRLRERLESGSDSGTRAFPRWRLPDGVRTPPGRLPKPAAQKLRILFRQWAGPLGMTMMQASWIIALVSALFIGAYAWMVLAVLMAAGIIVHFSSFYWTQAEVREPFLEEEIQEAAFDVWQSLPRDAQEGLQAVLRGLPQTGTEHPFLALVHPWPEPRRAAYAAAAPQLRARAALFAPLLARNLRQRLDYERSMMEAWQGLLPSCTVSDADFMALAALGRPGAAELAAMLAQPPAPASQVRLARALQVAELGRDERAAVAEAAASDFFSDEARKLLSESLGTAALDRMSEAPSPSGHSDLVSRARERIASLGNALPAKLTRGALEDAVAAVEAAAASGDEETMAAAVFRLEELLRDGAATGSAAMPGRGGGIGVKAATSLGSAAAAAVLSLAVLLSTLWAVAPVAAAAAGIAASVATWRTLAKPVPVHSSEFAPAPRAIERVPEEFKPVSLAMRRLAERLGVEAPNAALFDPKNPGDDPGGLNAMSLGPKLGPDSSIAVGESWLRASARELDGVLAHELGHLYYGDNRIYEALTRSAAVAWKSLLAAAGAALILGSAWLWLVPAAALFGAAVLARLAFQRAIEYRADRFAAGLAGPEAVRAFLKRIEPFAPTYGGAFISHPSPTDRLRRAPR